MGRKLRGFPEARHPDHRGPQGKHVETDDRLRRPGRRCHDWMRTPAATEALLAKVFRAGGQGGPGRPRLHAAPHRPPGTAWQGADKRIEAFAHADDLVRDKRARCSVRSRIFARCKDGCFGHKPPSAFPEDAVYAAPPFTRRLYRDTKTTLKLRLSAGTLSFGISTAYNRVTYPEDISEYHLNTSDQQQ